MYALHIFSNFRIFFPTSEIFLIVNTLKFEHNKDEIIVFTQFQNDFNKCLIEIENHIQYSL